MVLFAAYAYLAPATYQARAVVGLDIPAEVTANPLPPPAEAERRLRTAVFASERLTRALEQEHERSESEPVDKKQLMEETSIATTNGIRYEFIVPAGDADRAQRLANLLARIAVDRVPDTFDPPRAAPTSPEQQRRQESIRELAAFLSQHPEIVFDAPSSDDADADSSKDSRKDELLLNLYAEKRRLEKDLAAGLAAQASDNPYVETQQIDADVETLKRRLGEVDAAITARREALDGKKGQAKKKQVLPAALEKEWKEKLRAVAELGTKAPEAPVEPSRLGISARVLSEAAAPDSPIVPNRPRVLLFGLLAASVAAGGAWISIQPRPRRRGQGTRRTHAAPPPPAERAVPHGAEVHEAEPVGLADVREADRPTRPPSRRRESIPPPTPRIFADTELEPGPPEDRRLRPRGLDRTFAWGGVRANDDMTNGGDPAAAPLRRRGTMPLGSFVPPREQAENPRPSRPPESNTAYRFVSDPPPEVAHEPNEEKQEERAPDSSVVDVVEMPAWSPSPILCPELHRSLRDTLYGFALEHCFVLSITGTTESEDGKSQAAAEIALALAETGHPRILFMEGDFQRPSVHRFMQVDVPIARGFSRQLHTRSVVAPWGVVACTPTLHVLAEGALRSPGMLLSKQFEQCLTELKSYYDIIVIDAPIVSFELDCRALDSVSDGFIIVCRDPGSEEVSRARPLFSEKRFFAMLPPAA